MFMCFKAVIFRLSHYTRQTAGAIAITFAVMAPVLVGVSGMALDYARAYLVQQRLQQAIDSSALAAASSSNDVAEITQKVKDFFAANYPPEKIGATFDPVVQINGNEIHVTGNATYYTTFLTFFGFDEIDISAEVTVQREIQGLEVVLVMDNTGSMATNNNIATLRTAAANFVDILFAGTSNPNYIKIGLVPYSTSVNVGPYGLGYDTAGDYYDVAFVNNPHGLSYSTSDSEQWQGCVLADEYPYDTEDQEGPWDMYRYCLDGSENVVCDYRWIEECSGPWWAQTCEWVKSARRNPNYICPATPLVPLTSDQQELLDSIETMQARGHTYGNFGMVWGYRVLSPDYPFEEAQAWGGQLWRKAIVMMTDGINTMHPKYSAYGPTADHNISAGNLNTRFAEVCENLKEEGVVVYTVTFAGGVNESTKDYYRECATTEEHYYDAPSQDDLIDVFETISRELSNLHIKS